MLKELWTSHRLQLDCLTKGRVHFRVQDKISKSGNTWMCCWKFDVDLFFFHPRSAGCSTKLREKLESCLLQDLKLILLLLLPQVCRARLVGWLRTKQDTGAVLSEYVHAIFCWWKISKPGKSDVWEGLYCPLFIGKRAHWLAAWFADQLPNWLPTTWLATLTLTWLPFCPCSLPLDLVPHWLYFSYCGFLETAMFDCPWNLLPSLLGCSLVALKLVNLLLGRLPHMVTLCLPCSWLRDSHRWLL